MGRNQLIIHIDGLSLLPPAARKSQLISEAVLQSFALERSRKSGEISIVFVSRQKMRALNQQFLGHDYDTDVITFEHEEPLQGPSEETPLGDIYISSWMAREQAQSMGHPILRETLTLVAHGALHLLGYRDDTEPERKKMFRKQDRVLSQILP